MSSIARYLPLVQRPARYMGGEPGSLPQRHDGSQLRIALLFPDVYEVGMSHQGLRILYRILNEQPDVIAERAFSPWPDMERWMRHEGCGILSLETQTPLREFDIIAVTLQYELSYSNVLNALDICGLPLRASQRDETQPLIIAGGPVAFGAEPLAPFMDMLFIGDAETAIAEMAREFHRVRQRGGCLRNDAHLRDWMLARDGYYLPALGPHPVRKAIEPRLEGLPASDRPVVPLSDAVHNRATVEISRGCTRGCRFCQAGMIYRPVRDREAASIYQIANCALGVTGSDELGFLSLSATDYAQIDRLMTGFLLDDSQGRTRLSLPSLRADSLSDELLEQMQRMRTSSFTIAPEAGTQRMRDIINKGLSEADILAAARRAFDAGVQSLKLYFMIGLPFETDEDILGIAELATRLRQIGRDRSVRRLRVTVSVSNFVPKPHTPFQWYPMNSRAEIERKQQMLMRELRQRKFDYRFHSPLLSQLEGAFARGGQELADVLETACTLGCRFDAWDEHFDPERWQQAFAQHGHSLAAWAERRWDPEDVLPWDHVDSRLERSWLWAEWERARQQALTPDCRWAPCSGCGVCDTEIRNRLHAELPSLDANARQRLAQRDQQLARLPQAWIRLKYAKRGLLRFLSHLETIKALGAAIERAELPLATTQGFHRRPRLSFGDALGLGIASEAEYVDIALTDSVDEAQALAALQRQMPADMPALKLRAGKFETISTAQRAVWYSARCADQIREDRWQQSHWPWIRTSPKKTLELDLRRSISRVHRDDDQVVFCLQKPADGPAARPFEIIAWLCNLRMEDVYGIALRKTAVEGPNLF